MGTNARVSHDFNCAGGAAIVSHGAVIVGPSFFIISLSLSTSVLYRVGIDVRSGVLGIACFGARFRIGDVCDSDEKKKKKKKRRWRNQPNRIAPECNQSQTHFD